MRGHRAGGAWVLVPTIVGMMMIAVACGGSDDESSSSSTTSAVTTTVTTALPEVAAEQDELGCDAQARFLRGVRGMRPDAGGVVIDSAADLIVKSLNDLSTMDDHPDVVAAADTLLPVAESLAETIGPETSSEEVEAMAGEQWVDDPAVTEAGNTILEFDFGCTEG